MPYSLDLRIRVVESIEQGTSVSKAARIYRVGRATIYRWLSREDLKPTKISRRKRQLDWNALLQDVRENPDTSLSQRAQKFGVSAPALCYAFKQMKITRKKNSYVIGNEIEKKGSSTTRT
jgi:putative transposase